MYVLAIMVYDFVVKSEFRRGGVIHAIVSRFCECILRVFYKTICVLFLAEYCRPIPSCKQAPIITHVHSRRTQAKGTLLPPRVRGTRAPVKRNCRNHRPVHIGT